MRAVNRLFATEFDDHDSYAAAPPSDAYLANALADDKLIALAALEGTETVGGLVAYILEKLEQERSEIYIYDLAVLEPHRRRGVATQLISTLQGIARDIRAYVIFVQADYGDDPAIRLYEKLGTREEVLHFDIGVD